MEKQLEQLSRSVPRQLPVYSFSSWTGQPAQVPYSRHEQSCFNHNEWHRLRRMLHSLGTQGLLRQQRPQLQHRPQRTPTPTATPTATATPTIQVTVQTNLAGLSFTVDSTTYTSTQHFPGCLAQATPLHNVTAERCHRGSLRVE